MPSKVSKFLLLTVSIIIAIGMSEAALRIVDLPLKKDMMWKSIQFVGYPEWSFQYVNRQGKDVYFTYPSNPRGYFAKGGHFAYRVNEYGFRGPKFPFDKPENTFRILFLGDSFTLGEGVWEKDIFSYKLVNHLQSANWKNKDITIEAVNLGVGGYNSENELKLLNHLGNKLDPDLVVLTYMINDVEELTFFWDDKGNFVRKELNELNFTDPEESFESPSHIIQLIKYSISKFHKTQTTIKYYQDLYQEGNERWHNTQLALQAMAGWAQMRNKRIIVAIMPILFRLQAYPFEEIHEKIASTLDNLHVEYIDLYPILKQYQDKDLWVHPIDHHGNEIVHDILAKELFKKLTESSKE